MAVRGKKSVMYTPSKTVEYEQYVAEVASRYCIEPFNCKVTVNATFFFKPGPAPDIDNCLKALLDGMNKIAYTDDSLVRRVSCERKDVATDDEERTELIIKRWVPRKYKVSWRRRHEDI
jgi:Holliday junction resolvase RusA-like endonuclease